MCIRANTLFTAFSPQQHISPMTESITGSNSRNSPAYYPNDLRPTAGTTNLCPCLRLWGCKHQPRWCVHVCRPTICVFVQMVGLGKCAKLRCVHCKPTIPDSAEVQQVFSPFSVNYMKITPAFLVKVGERFCEWEICVTKNGSR